jgi:hypothetical protein
VGELSLGLVLALLLLAPGLAAYAAIFHSGRTPGSVDWPPPPPGSILTLAIITIGALVAHVTGALLFEIQDWTCAAWGHCLTVGFRPNAFATLVDLATERHAIRLLDAIWLLATLLALTAASFALTRQAAGLDPVAGALRAVLYGWLNNLIVVGSDNEILLAHVLSDVQSDGSVVGYEGAVVSLVFSSQRQITSILLSDCITFYLLVTKHGVERIETAPDVPMQQVYLQSDRIKNIAFERLSIDVTAA